MAERKQIECEVCGSASFNDGGDGFYYCARCCSQLNDIIDTAVDEHEFNPDGGIYATSQRRRRTRAQNSQAQHISQVLLSQSQHLETLADGSQEDNGRDGFGPDEPRDFGSSGSSLTYTDYYSVIRLRYVMGVQIMIQLQCKALVEKFNVSPLIVGIVEPIWLRYLAHEKIMADEWADTVIQDSEAQTEGDIDTFKPSGNKGEPRNLLGKRAVTLWHKCLSHVIPLHCSLAISLLACHIAREAILPTDILKWAFEGELPYFAAFLEIEKQLGPASRACPLSTSQMFRPIFPIKLQKLECVAVSIARNIGLELPPVNFRAIASRYLEQLSLPTKKILPRACQVYEWSLPPELYLSDREYRLPSRVCVISILIVTIRIIYELNGGKWEMGLSSFGDEENESDFDVSKVLKILEEKYEELSDTYDFSKDLQSYLQYCKDVVFAGLEPSFEDYEEEKIIGDFWDFYQSHKAEEASDDGKVESQTQRESNDVTINRCKCNNDDKSNAVSCSKCGWESKRLRRLKEDMQENRFCYLPPRVHVKKKDRYVRYVRKREGGAYVYAAHADYYILLRSFAKVAQVDVRTMHFAVLSFEKRLEMLETRIDYCLHKRLPNDSCDFCCEDSKEESS